MHVPSNVIKMSTYSGSRWQRVSWVVWVRNSQYSVQSFAAAASMVRGRETLYLHSIVYPYVGMRPSPSFVMDMAHAARAADLERYVHTA